MIWYKIHWFVCLFEGKQRVIGKEVMWERIERGRRETCKRISRSELCLVVKRFSWKFWRAFSISRRSWGDPSLGSNSHTCLPTWLLNERSHGLPPSANLSFHIVVSEKGNKRVHCNCNWIEKQMTLIKRLCREWSDKIRTAWTCVCWEDR